MACILPRKLQFARERRQDGKHLCNVVVRRADLYKPIIFFVVFGVFCLADFQPIFQIVRVDIDARQILPVPRFGDDLAQVRAARLFGRRKPGHNVVKHDADIPIAKHLLAVDLIRAALGGGDVFRPRKLLRKFPSCLCRIWLCALSRKNLARAKLLQCGDVVSVQIFEHKFSVHACTSCASSKSSHLSNNLQFLSYVSL